MLSYSYFLFDGWEVLLCFNTVVHFSIFGASRQNSFENLCRCWCEDFWSEHFASKQFAFSCHLFVTHLVSKAFKLWSAKESLGWGCVMLKIIYEVLTMHQTKAATTERQAASRKDRKSQTWQQIWSVFRIKNSCADCFFCCCCSFFCFSHLSLGAKIKMGKKDDAVVKFLYQTPTKLWPLCTVTPLVCVSSWWARWLFEEQPPWR